MHAIAEIVIPPDCDVVATVGQVMSQFNEQPLDDEDGYAKHGFWDFFVIGGRFSGNKLETSLDQEKLKAFHQELIRRKVTVSGLVCGKESLQPESQIPMVDGLWREWFPENGHICPLFSHGRDQYRKDGYYEDDVCKVNEVPDTLTCERLLIAGPCYWSKDHPEKKGRFEAKDMLSKEYYNGCRFQDTDFDGNVKKGLAKIKADERRKTVFEDNWLVVTVDYHT